MNATYHHVRWGWNMKLFFDDQNFDGQLQRSVGKADAGMANVGECLAIAAQITGGDRDSWYQAWSTFGLGLVEQADTALAAGHRVSARSAYLRATEYLRQAFFFHRENLDGNEIRMAYAASVAAFRKALPLLNHQSTVLTGVLEDRAAVYGVLAQIEVLGLDLLELRRTGKSPGSGEEASLG